jgi:hypothetical protein
MTFDKLQALRSRRSFLRTAANGVGMWALGDLLAADGLTAATANPDDPLAPRAPHFAPKAKHVIYMFMEGGPSQYELFDPKPELEKWDGKSLPSEMTKDLKLAYGPLRAVAEPGRGRRRHCARPLGAHRRL